MNDAIDSALTAWMTDITSDRHGLLASHSREALASFEATAKLTPTGISVTGDQDVARQQAILAEAQNVHGAKSPEAVDAMLEHPATGMMHISDMARIASKWNPMSLEDPGANELRYNDYLNKLLNMPLLTLDYAEHQRVVRQSSDWNELIDGIADLFTGIQASDKDQIRTSLTGLAKAASSKMSTDERTDLFCQSALNTGNDVYQLFLYSTNVTFHEEKGKGFDTKQSTFDVRKLRLTLKYDLWTRDFVQRLIGKTSDSLDDWINQNQTEVDDSVKIVALA